MAIGRAPGNGRLGRVRTAVFSGPEAKAYIAGMSPGRVADLHDRCRVLSAPENAANAVQRDYVVKSLANLGAREFVIFATLADAPVGFAKCRLAGRALRLDLLCAQGRDRVRGVGALLMGAVERLAQRLHARALRLDSVDSAAGFYERMGFARGPTPVLSPAAVRRAREAYRARRQAGMRRQPVMRDMFFEGHDFMYADGSIDSLAFSKAVPAPSTAAPSTAAPAPARLAVAKKHGRVRNVRP